MADNVTVRAAGLVLPTQTDVKVRWADGSVRHALVSFLIPQLQANQTQTIELLAGGPNYNSGWVTKDQLLASDFEALASIVVGSTPFNVSARQMLQGIASPEYWIKGGIATEFIIRDFSSNILKPAERFLPRPASTPSAGMIRVSTVVDNTWINARGNLTYDVALSLGKSIPQPVYSKAGLTHFHDARWHKVFWQGTTPPKIETRYNLAYLIKTGALPNYDTSLVIPTSTITGEYNNWSSSAPRHHGRLRTDQVHADDGRPARNRPLPAVGQPLPGQHGLSPGGGDDQLRRPVRHDPDALPRVRPGPFVLLPARSRSMIVRRSGLRRWMSTTSSSTWLPRTGSRLPSAT